MDRVSKTLSEAEACVSDEAETGKGEHGVRVERSDTLADPVFAFRSIRHTGENRPEALSDKLLTDLT
jgi:hypothetical protein